MALRAARVRRVVRVPGPLHITAGGPVRYRALMLHAVGVALSLDGFNIRHGVESAGLAGVGRVANNHAGSIPAGR